MRQASRGTSIVKVSNNNLKSHFSILLKALPFSVSIVQTSKIFLLILTIFIGFSNAVFAADKINVYYFYGKPRCATCMKIEKYTQGAVVSINDKSIIYKSIDMENPENAPSVKKYNLFTKSVIISKTNNGKEKWKNLDKIWLKVGNEQEFKKYVTSEIKNFKGAK